MAVITPQQEAPTKRRWYTKKRFIIPLALLFIIVAWNAINGSPNSTPASQTAGKAAAEGKAAGDDKAQAAQNSEPNEKGDPQVAGLGDAVRDGDFEFIVSKVSCGKTTIGESYLNTKAQGQFCLASLTVKNTSDKANSMSGEYVKAKDAQGREFSADTGAAIYLKDSKAILEEINPGNTMKGTVIFDVPKNTKITELELHDSPFSGGVTVKVN